MRVAVALEIPMLKVEGLVTVARCLPGKRGAGKLTGLEGLSLEPAFAGLVVAGAATHTDVEVDAADRIVAEFLQLIPAVISLIRTRARGQLLS